ncbi:MAG: PEP/pyruvate-binding domain-containing protein [candidate division KSB1 bacterium]|nr:PEP/pyruvate-binding domain-containing protein [candidate division KSB1 bacterium]
MMIRNFFYARKQTINKKSKLIGGKACVLAKLYEIGIPVPDFFVLSAKACVHQKRIHLEKQLESFLEKHEWNISKETPLAVRSSAPFEDDTVLSWAGQLESYLNLTSIHGVLDSIEKIWRSINDPRVMKYMSYFSYPRSKRTIAVLIQRMVRPLFSGIMFTSHPVWNQTDSLLIEVAPGSCEKVTAGTLNPVQVYVNKKDSSIQVSNINNPKLQAFIHSDYFNQLIELGIKIENYFQAGQDIEWAFDGEQVWILQSRPITSIQDGRIAFDTEGQPWTDYFFAERFVEPLSPLGWSILDEKIVKNAFREPLWYLGYDHLAREKKLSRLFNGMPYIRLAAFHNLYAIIPVYLISEDKRKALKLTHDFHDSVTSFVRALPYLITRLSGHSFQWLPFYNLKQWNQFKRRMPMIENLKNRVEQSESFEEFKSIFLTTEKLTESFLAIHRWSITFADIFSILLEKYLKRIDNGTLSLKAIDLLSGLAHNKTVEINLALKNCKTDREFEQFLSRYGYRSESLDIAQPSWAESGERIKQLLETVHRTEHTASIGRLDESRKQKEAECIQYIQTLPWSVRYPVKWIFKTLLYYGQEFTRLRENQRDAWHQILFVMRHTVLKTADKLMAQKRLYNRNDMFYLTRKEFLKLLASDDQAVINIDRKKYSEFGRKPPVKHVKEKNKNTHILTGIGVSRGHAVGRVRIAETYEQALQAQYGDILVTHSADPAWSPVFNLLSGLIMETGGILSHASIIAREYGLPAVTSVQHATDIFTDGEIVELSGERGMIKRFKEQEEPQA